MPDADNLFSYQRSAVNYQQKTFLVLADGCMLIMSFVHDIQLSVG
jgi:hypothetical protein